MSETVENQHDHAQPADLTHELDDHFHDQCGVFGVYNSGEAAQLTYLGLHALQHRGQESCGIAASDNKSITAHRSLGLVGEVFNEKNLKKLIGIHAIGHVRYATHGDSALRDAQPLVMEYAGGSLAIAHNGNLTNADELRKELEEEGSIFQSTTDTEVIVHLIAKSRAVTLENKIIESLARLQGAYSLLILGQDTLFAVRDPMGFRPLCLGQRGECIVASSEPPAFTLIDAEFLREIAPGELVKIDKQGIHSSKPFPKKEGRFCIFEYVYFARPDANLGNISVYEARKRLGAQLANEQPADADIVIPVPDSGTPAAIGYAQRVGLPFEFGLIRSHYIGRTFIEPSQAIRNFGVRLKLSPVHDVLRGKRVVVVDDSIVRGTTSRKLVDMIRHAGAKEVHLRISSPPTQWPCFYGIDTPTREELIAANKDVKDIARYVGSDTLGYLSLEGLHSAIGDVETCDACFTGNYPTPHHTARHTSKRQLTLL